MRKRFLSFVLVVWMLSAFGVQAFAVDADKVADGGTEETFKAQISKMEILLDGETVTPSGYLITQGEAAYTYFKLRDIAYLMRSKECKFSVAYDSETRRISVVRGGDYQADGSEMKAAESVKSALKSSLPIWIDGQTASLEAFNINGFTYYKLRDMGEALGFDVDYRNASKQGVMKTPGYVEPEPEPEPEPTPEPDSESGTSSDPEQVPPYLGLDPETEVDSEPEPEPEPAYDPKAHIDGQLTVLIDVGHGGSDGGSEGVAPTAYTNYQGQAVEAGSKVLEKDFNLPVALYLRDLLEASGVKVIMTRESDVYVSFTKRKEIIEDNAEIADLCFSVHHNAYNTKAVGFELLAQVQYKNGGAGAELGAILEKYYYANDRVRHRPTVFREGQQGDYYAILRYAANVGMLAMISEYAFIDNAEDVQCVLSDEGLYAEAQAMCNGILEYFETHEY